MAIRFQIPDRRAAQPSVRASMVAAVAAAAVQRRLQRSGSPIVSTARRRVPSRPWSDHWAERSSEAWPPTLPARQTRPKSGSAKALPTNRQRKRPSGIRQVPKYQTLARENDEAMRRIEVRKGLSNQQNQYAQQTERRNSYLGSVTRAAALRILPVGLFSVRPDHEQIRDSHITGREHGDRQRGGGDCGDALRSVTFLSTRAGP